MINKKQFLDKVEQNVSGEQVKYYCLPKLKAEANNNDLLGTQITDKYFAINKFNDCFII